MLDSTIENNICQTIRSNGQRCKAKAMTGSSFCFFPQPGQGEGARGRKKGWWNSTKPTSGAAANTPEWPLASPAEVARFLPFIINKLFRGQLDLKVGYIIGPLISALMKA